MNKNLHRIINETVRQILERKINRYAEYNEHGDPADENAYLDSYDYAIETLINGNLHQFKEMTSDYTPEEFHELIEVAKEELNPQFAKEFFNKLNGLYPNLMDVDERWDMAQHGLIDYPDDWEFDDGSVDEAIKMSINHFLNEDGATAAGGGATSSFNVGASAGNNGAGNGFEYDVPVGASKRNKGGDVMRRTFWTAGNSEKTMQSVDDEGTDVVNKRKKR